MCYPCTSGYTTAKKGSFGAISLCKRKLCFDRYFYKIKALAFQQDLQDSLRYQQQPNHFINPNYNSNMIMAMPIEARTQIRHYRHLQNENPLSSYKAVIFFSLC